MNAPKATIPEATTVAELLEQICQVTKGGNYIYRGENKKNDKICSTLYRQFQTIAGQAELQKITPKINFCPIRKMLENLLPESLEKSDFDIIEKSLKENVSVQLAQKRKARTNVENIQKKFILRDVQEYVDFEDEFVVLEKLQHYGGFTNLIDFSQNLAIALFFACDGEPKKNGRLILFCVNAKTKGVTYPKKNRNSRSVFQESVFVRRDDGFIDEQEIEQIVVSQNLKKELLTCVQSRFDIRTETIYGDLEGYIQNQERHREAYENFFTGLIYFIDGKSAEAIKCYKNAIDLKPNFSEACYYCGLAYQDIHKYGCAIESYSEAIKLNPKHADAYCHRGRTKMNLNPRKLKQAISDYDEAIKLNPKYAYAYYYRGIAKGVLKTKGAKEDIETALQLAKKQGKKDLVAKIQKLIAKPSSDSDS